MLLDIQKTMLTLMEDKPELGIISDQIGTPTYAIDLAKFIIHIVEIKSEKFGVYHYSNNGLCSWYDFSKSIFEYTNNAIKVNPVASSVFKTKAIRRRVDRLCSQLRPKVGQLVDAFGIPNGSLVAPIALK